MTFIILVITIGKNSTSVSKLQNNMVLYPIVNFPILQRQRNSNNYWEQYRKKARTNIQNQYKKGSKEVKSNSFCYCKVGGEIKLLGAIEIVR